MEVAVGIGGAVRGDQQIAARKGGACRGRQLDLHRPVGELPGHGLSRCRRGFRRHLPDAAAGTAGVSRGLGSLGRLHRRLVVGRSLPLLKGDGAGGAGRQTVSQPVAVVLPHQSGLAVHQVDGPLMAGVDTLAAAVTLFLIDVNDPPDHADPSYSCCAVSVYSRRRAFICCICHFAK